MYNNADVGKKIDHLMKLKQKGLEVTLNIDPHFHHLHQDKTDRAI